MAAYVAKKTVQSIIKSGANIAESKVLVMGCTFKENVSDIRNSKVADVIKELQAYNVTVHVTDTHADSAELQHEYGFGLETELSNDYDAVIVAVNHDAYSQHDEAYFKSISKANALIVDLKGVFRGKITQLKYWSL
jgi:UDP-N-acetyl-D-galactosamine dehydrogenase